MKVRSKSSAIPAAKVKAPKAPAASKEAPPSSSDAPEAGFDGVKKGKTPRPSPFDEPKTLVNTPAYAVQVLNRHLGDHVFAAVDLGSSSVKMLVMAVGSNGKTRVLEDMRIGTNLGKGVLADGTIPDANQQRVLDALHTFMETAARHGVDAADVPLIATAAVRNAPNGASFLDRIRTEAGVARARVLSGDEEAQTGFKAALLGLEERPAGRYATLDLGGGSFQLALGTQDTMEKGASTQVGSNKVQETLLPAGAITSADFKKADDALQSMAPMPLPVEELRGARFVGMGGVALFLRAQFGRNQVGRAEIEALRERIGPLEPKERARVLLEGVPDETRKALGVDTPEGELDYATKLPAKLTLLLHILRGVGLDELHISNADARHLLIAQDRARQE